MKERWRGIVCVGHLASRNGGGVPRLKSVVDDSMGYSHDLTCRPALSTQLLQRRRSRIRLPFDLHPTRRKGIREPE
jgi:hypothetical protein